MNQKVFLLVSALSVASAAQAQWATQRVGFANPLAAPYFIKAVDANTVWTIGFDLDNDDTNQVGRSTDGGLNWNTSVVTGVNSSNESVTSLSALNGTTAWVGVVGSRADGRILKTTDGGQTWVRQTTPAQFGDLNSYPTVVHFFNANEGVAFGDPPVDGGPFEVYTSSNGGTTWTAVSTPPSDAREDAADNVYAVQGNTIWCGTLQGRVLRSTDKGLTWTVANTGLGDAVQALAFRDAQNGLALSLDFDSGQRQLARTTDGGLTWALVTYTGGLPGFGLDNVPGTNQYVSTGPNLGDGIRGTAYSRDNGQTWVTLESANDNLYVDFVGPTAGWTGALDLSTLGGLGMRRFTSTVLGNRPATPAQAGFDVAPNPSADGRFAIRSSRSRPGGAELRVSDALGREVLRRTWHGNAAAPFTLDLSACRTGIYTLQIQSEGAVSQEKLVVR